MKLTYAVVFEQTPNNYCAHVPDVPGCVSLGDTWDEMQAMIREALAFHIEDLPESGEPLPEPKTSINEAIAPPQRTHPRGCPRVLRRVRRRHSHALDAVRAGGDRGPRPAGGLGKLTIDRTQVPQDWPVVRLGDAAEVTFSSVDKKTVDGELPVELCNYTDVFYNLRIARGMLFMAATASPAECKKWTLRQGDVLFTKDSETPDEIGIPAYVSEDLPGTIQKKGIG